MKTVSSFSREPGFLEHDDAGPDFSAIAGSEEFTQLRRRLLRFVIPASVLFLTWYLTYVLLGAYAHDFMSTRVFGTVTVGLILGFSQFLTTVVIMLGYLAYTKRRVDPAVAQLRARVNTANLENEHDR